MRFKIAALITLLCSTAVFSHGQTRRTKRPAPKPSHQQAQPKDDPNAITLLYSADGRNYYLHEVVKHQETDDLSYSYVVVFDQSTPAGRSALNKMIALAKLMVVDSDQPYYVTAVEYQCHFSPKEPNNIRYEDVFWIDRTGNTVAQLQIKLEDSANLKAQVAEIASYSEPYLQKLFDSLDRMNEAQRRSVEARIQLLIDTGREGDARQLKFEPDLPKYLPALSLVISGGTEHMSKVLAAAYQAYQKRTRIAK